MTTKPTKFKIEKGVPKPFPGRRLLPWREMEIGDSFFVPGKTTTLASVANRYYAPNRYESHTVTENGVKGCRVWRTA